MAKSAIKVKKGTEVIGDFEISYVSWAKSDILKIINETHPDYHFGIMLMDIMGHSEIKYSSIEKKILDKKPPIWYKEKTASNALQTLRKKINGNKKRYNTKKVDPLEMSAIFYFLFKKDSINYANSAMTTPIIIKKGKIKLLNEVEKGPPIGFFKDKKDYIEKFEENDVLFLYSDGLFHNSCVSGRLPKRLKEKASKKIAFNIAKLPNIDYEENYQETLIEVIQENKGQSISVLKKEAIKKIKKKRNQYPEIKNKLERIEKDNEISKKLSHDKIFEIQQERVQEFQQELIQTLEENWQEKPERLINIITERHQKDFIPEKAPNYDDVTIVILKKVA